MMKIFVIPRVLQYFDNMKPNLEAPNTFDEVMKVTNHIGLLDAKLA